MTEHESILQLRRPRRHHLLIALLVVSALGTGYLLGATRAAPIGHWRSTEGRAAYLEAYDVAFAELPAPA